MTTDRLLGMVPPDRQGSMGGGTPGATPAGQGRLVGRRYRLLSPVGRGGMGMVWHAHDVLLDRDVAVKELILPYGLDHAGKQVAHRRMLREARSAARLSHPGIVTVHDVVEEDGQPWIVMELVRAWSLEQAVRQSGPLPVVQAAEIGIRVLDALRHAHAAGILHRDVKPGNVLLTSDRVVLTDFGIAAIEGDVTITQTGLLMGSPAYIPPERLRGRPITHAADLWSFGATLYAAVEGRPPYEGPDAVAVLGAVLTQEPNRPQRAGAMLPVIEGLLRKNPADRIGAAQVADMLENVLRNHGTGLSGRGHDPQVPAPVPTPQDSTPARLLPPLDIPSGPLPSRIIETPSGPIRLAYDPLASPSGAYPMPQQPPGSAGAGEASGAVWADSVYPRLESESPGARRAPDAGWAHGGADAAWPPSASPSISPADPLGRPTRDSSNAAPQGLSAPHDPLASPQGLSGAQDPFAAPQGLSVPQDPLASPQGLSGAQDPFGNPQSSVPQDPFAAPSPFDALSAPAFDTFASPSGSTHARERPSGPMWPIAAPADLPGQLAGDLARELAQNPEDPFTTGAGQSSTRTGGVRSRGTGAWTQETGSQSRDGLESSGGRQVGRPPGRRRATPVEPVEERDSHLTVLVVVAAFVVIGVLTAIVLAMLPSGSGDQETSQQRPAAVPAAAQAPGGPSEKPSSTSAEVPKNFKTETAGGVSVAVPKTWTVSTRGGTVTFAGPADSAQSITVEKIPDGSLSALRAAEQKLNITDYPDYTQIQLGDVVYGWPAADWEYTYTNARKVTVHSVTRYLETDNQAYSITFRSPDYDWNESAATTRQILWNTFTIA